MTGPACGHPTSNDRVRSALAAVAAVHNVAEGRQWRATVEFREGNKVTLLVSVASRRLGGDLAEALRLTPDQRELGRCWTGDVRGAHLSLVTH